MAEFQTIVERTISGKGLIRVPSDYTKSRLLILYASVIRKPKNIYLNKNYNPPESLYAYLVFRRQGYVVSTEKVRFEQQCFDTLSESASQVLIAVKCAYKGTLQSFVNFAVALNLPYIQVTNLIKDFEYLQLAWDEIRVNCYADTAMSFKLAQLAHDTCDEESDKPRKPPPPPPPTREPVPPGTPINPDPPYADEENPDTYTEPYDGDSPLEPPVEPPGNQCDIYKFTFVVYFRNPPVINSMYELYGYGEIEAIYTPIPGAESTAALRSRGFADSPNGLGACGNDQTSVLESSVYLSGCEITSFEKYTG